MPMILWLEWGIDWFVEPWSNAPMQRGHVGALRFQGSWKLARKVVRKQLWKKSQTGLHFVASFEAFGYLCNPGGYQVSFWKESTLLERLVGYLAEKSEKKTSKLQFSPNFHPHAIRLRILKFRPVMMWGFPPLLLDVSGFVYLVQFLQNDYASEF